MKTDTPFQLFSPSERLTLFLRKHLKTFFSRSISGLQQIPQALREHRHNPFYPVIMRQLLGSLPWLRIILIVAALILLKYIIGLCINIPLTLMTSPPDFQHIKRAMFLLDSTFLFPIFWLAFLLAWRYRTFMTSSLYKDHIAMIPQSRAPVFQTLELQILIVSILYIIAATIVLKVISWNFIDASFRGQHSDSLLRYIFNVKLDTPLWFGVMYSLSGKIALLLKTIFYFFLIVWLLLCMRRALISFCAAIALSISLSYAYDNMILLVTRVIRFLELQAYHIFNVQLPPTFWGITVKQTENLCRLVVFIVCLLILIGFIWDSARRRFCSRKLPFEEQ